MATPVQEQSRLRAIIAAEDQALERTLQQATARTLSAVRRLVVGQRNAGSRIRRAWRRPPPKHFQRQMTARKGRALPGSGARRVTFHFGLKRSHSGKNAAAHQHYIEREEACVASFGNIADEFSERCRVWKAIDERGGQRKGSIHIGANAPGALRAMAIKSMERWRDEGRVSAPLTAKITRLGKTHWPNDGVRIWTHDADDHATMSAWLRGWETENQSQKTSAEEPSEDEPTAGRQATLPGFESDDADAAERAQAREKKSKELKRKAAARRGLPRDCAEFIPRRTIIQRRIELELAHELPLEAQTRALKRWCDEALGAAGVSYHAVIHQPEGQNDVRNWHAHVVCAPITATRERDTNGDETGKYEFERGRRLPPMPALLRALAGNGPQGRRGAGEVVKRWREQLATIQNEELARAGATKRYDARSYKDQGIDRVGGQHRGTKRAALEASGRAADHWSHECPEWTQLLDDIGRELENWQATDAERGGVHEAIEEARLEMGAHAPNAGAQLRRWGREVQKAIRGEPTRSERPNEGWRPEVRELVRTIRATARECTVYVPPAQWQVAWRAARRTQTDPIRLGAVADRIAEQYPGGTEALAADPRPEPRAIAARARRFRNERQTWRTRHAQAQLQGEEAVRRFARAAVSASLPIEIVFEPQTASALRGHVERARTEKQTRRTLSEAKKEIQRSTATEGHAVAQTLDWAAIDMALGTPSAKRHRNEIEARIGAAAIRETWERACAAGAEAIVEFHAGANRHPLWPPDAHAERRALGELDEKEHAVMAEGRTNPAQTAVEYQKAQTLVRETLARLDEGPGGIDAIARSSDTRTVLSARAPQAAQIIEQRMTDQSAKRKKIRSALKRAGIEPEGDAGQIARRAAKLDVEGTLAIASISPKLIAHDDRALWRALYPNVKAWARETRDRIEAGHGVDPRWAEPRYAQLAEALGARVPRGRIIAEAIRQAHATRSDTTREVRARVEREVRAMHEATTGTERARAREHLRATLTEPGVRTVLGARAAEAIAHGAGLRDRTAPPAVPERGPTAPIGAGTTQ